MIVRADEDSKICVPFIGSSPPQVTFAKGGNDIKLDGNIQVTVKDSVAELVVPKVKGDDTGLYSCTLKNHLGQETVQAKVVVDKPDLFYISNKIKTFLVSRLLDSREGLLDVTDAKT